MKKLIGVMCLAVSMAGLAQTRAVDLSVELHDPFGQPFLAQLDPAPAKPRAMTLADAAINALETPLPDDQKMTGEAKFKMDELARKLVSNHKATLSDAELATVRDRIGKVYTAPAIVGAAWRALDGSK